MTGSRIAVNACFLRHSRVGGAEQMLLNLVEGLDGLLADAVAGTASEVVSREKLITSDGWGRLRPRILPQMPSINRMAFESLALPKVPAPDVWLHTNYFTPPRLRVPSVTVIHDAHYLHLPDSFSPAKRWWLAAAHRHTLHHAAHVVAISEFTRQDLLRRFGSRFDDKISVIPNAVSFSRLGPDADWSPDQDEPYLLAVAAHYPHKNLQTLIDAHSLLEKSRPIRLMLVGQPSSELAGSVNAPAAFTAARDRVTFTGYVSDERLGRLYRGASSFVHPSLFEGFGLPVVEALALRVPTITTRCAAIPEVAGKYPAYVDDPRDANELAAVISYTLDHPDVARPSLEQAAALRARYAPSEVAAAYLSLVGAVG